MSLERSIRAASFAPLTPQPTDAAEQASGYSAGYSAGWSAGARAAAREAEAQKRRLAQEAAVRAQEQADAARQALAVLAQAADSARRRTAPVVADAQDALAAGVVELAEALLGAELRDEDASARAALRRALAVGEDEEVVRVRLNPEDLAHLHATLHHLPADLQLPPGVELLPDPSLPRGDAMSELTEGFLDARLARAIARVKAALEVES